MRAPVQNPNWGRLPQLLPAQGHPTRETVSITLLVAAVVTRPDVGREGRDVPCPLGVPTVNRGSKGCKITSRSCCDRQEVIQDKDGDSNTSQELTVQVALKGFQQYTR